MRVALYKPTTFQDINSMLRLCEIFTVNFDVIEPSIPPFTQDSFVNRLKKYRAKFKNEQHIDAHYHKNLTEFKTSIQNEVHRIIVVNQHNGHQFSKFAFSDDDILVFDPSDSLVSENTGLAPFRLIAFPLIVDYSFKRTNSGPRNNRSVIR
jgi:tRNA(Leu) C34 or U34 (ribose-2'-O)-methylase TrmL